MGGDRAHIGLVAGVDRARGWPAVTNSDGGVLLPKMKTTTRILAFRGDEEEEDDVVEEDRSAIGPFWLLALLEVVEDDTEA